MARHSSEPIVGFILEGEPGWFYHRSGCWIEYDSPLRGYVWPSEEAAFIQANLADVPKVTKAYPAHFFPNTGVTAMTGEPVGADALSNGVPTRDPEIPLGGNRFNLSFGEALAPGDVVASMASL
jgi:hypothetical protein